MNAFSWEIHGSLLHPLCWALCPLGVKAPHPGKAPQLQELGKCGMETGLARPGLCRGACWPWIGSPLAKRKTHLGSEERKGLCLVDFVGKGCGDGLAL